jgi:hypothetical protein
MMKLIRRTVGVLFLATVLVTPGPAQAANSNGPYYATPSWDQQLQCDTQPTCPRFIVLSNWIDASHPSGGAAVLDRETGLVWEQSPSTTLRQWAAHTLFLDSAQSHCNNSNVGKRKGWRLPTIQELASLIDPTQSNPALPAGHPFSNVQSDGYWSATTDAASAVNAWVVDFFSGDVFEGGKGGFDFAWCVRGGQGGDPQ